MADIKSITFDGITQDIRPAHFMSKSKTNFSLAANTITRTDFITLDEPGYYYIITAGIFTASTTTGDARRVIGYVKSTSPTTMEGFYVDNSNGGYALTTKAPLYLKVGNTPIQIAGAISSNKASNTGCSVSIIAMKIANLDD